MKTLDAKIYQSWKRKPFSWWHAPVKLMAEYGVTPRQAKAALARLVKAGLLPPKPENPAADHDALLVLSEEGSHIKASCRICLGTVELTRFRFDSAKACSASCAAKLRWQRAK